MNQIITLDIHAHLVPVVPEQLASFSGVLRDGAREELTIDGHRLAMKSLFRPFELISWMERNHVDRAWISVPPPVYRAHLREVDAAAWCGYLNCGLIGIESTYPERLAAMLHLPVEHPRLAHQIANKYGDRRLFAMAAGAGPGVALSNPDYVPLWELLNDRAGFLFLHPGEGFDRRCDPYYLQNLVGNPIETTIAAAHLVHGGILQRYPRMRVGLAHAGGMTFCVAGRLQRGRDTKRPGIDLDLEKPRHSLRRLIVDCIAHDNEALALAASVYGRDHVVFGSDWPFPMGLTEPHSQLADLEPGLRASVFVANPASLQAQFDPDKVAD